LLDQMRRPIAAWAGNSIGLRWRVCHRHLLRRISRQRHEIDQWLDN
jgi:hypothetical protein